MSLVPISFASPFSGASQGLTLFFDGSRLLVPRAVAPSADIPSGELEAESASWPAFPVHPEHTHAQNATVWMPPALYLERTFTVPAAAARELDHIAHLELERATPFKANDVFSAYVAGPTPGNNATLSVRQFISKKETVAEVQRLVEGLGLHLRRLTGLDRASQRPLPINFLGNSDLDVQGKSSGLAVLAAVLLLLLATAGAVAVVRSERAFSEIARETAAARGAWQKQQSTASSAAAQQEEATAIASLRAQHVPTVLVLAELTQQLPDDVYLSDVKVSEGSVVIMGQGRDTARLIPLLDSSRLFSDAELAAPVMTDADSDLERFSIRVKIRASRAADTAAEAPL
ncbi:MAG: PilN domain-containing protein [Hyphomicrobium sp.]